MSTFQEASAKRSVTARLYIETGVGKFVAPAEIERRWFAAQKRGDGRLDRRFKEGKELTRIEREFVAQKLREYAS